MGAELLTLLGRLGGGGRQRMEAGLLILLDWFD
jgi:hypothetical protein